MDDLCFYVDGTKGFCLLLLLSLLPLLLLLLFCLFVCLFFDYFFIYIPFFFLSFHNCVTIRIKKIRVRGPKWMTESPLENDAEFPYRKRKRKTLTLTPARTDDVGQPHLLSYSALDEDG